MSNLARSSRPHVCLDCRTLLRRGGRCPGGRTHRVVDLGTKQGRMSLIERVWGSPDARQRARDLAKAGGGGAGIGGLDACAGCDVVGGGPDALILAGIMLGAVALWWLLSSLWRTVALRAHRLSYDCHELPPGLRPRGAQARPASPGRATGRFGRVVAHDSAISSAASETQCVGYALELRVNKAFGSQVMLRHSHCAAFRIVLDDGEEVHVPSGTLALQGPAKNHPPDTNRLALYTNVPDFSQHDLTPFPFDRMLERLVRDGDRVEILGKVEQAPDADAQNYRAQRWRLLPDRQRFGLRVLAEHER